VAGRRKDAEVSPLVKALTERGMAAERTRKRRAAAKKNTRGK